MPIKRFNFKSLRTIFLSAIIIIIALVLGHFIYARVSGIVIAQVKSEAVELAKIAAKDIDGDVHKGIESIDSPEYAIVYDALSAYKDIESLKYIYTMKKVGKEEAVFVVDVDEENPAEFFEPYELLPGMALAFLGEPSFDDEISTDQWGTYLSGYAPVYDSNNEVVGIVGCDINIDAINERIKRLRSLVFVLLIVSNAIIVTMLKEKKT